MKEKLKKIALGYLPGFITGILFVGTISVIAATYFPSNQTTYDNSTSGLSSTNVQGAIDELYGVCTAKTGGDWVLDNTDIVTSGDGLYEDEYEDGKYTYKGANPNNYVTFNNEKAGWRIISINSDGTIKIIKDEKLDYDGAWNSGSSNDWNLPAPANTYLNSTYYNILTSTAQSQIITGTYYAGYVTWKNNDMKRQIYDEKQKTSNVKVALITASEFIRCNSNKSSCGTLSLHNSNYSTCKNTNWVNKNKIGWWTMTPSGNGNEILVANNDSTLTRHVSMAKYYSYYPVVTLSSSVKITGGTGTQSNPYTLG